MRQDGDRSFRRLHFFLVAVSCVNTAEAAVERTPDTRMVNGGTLSEEGWTEVLFDRNTVKRGPWELIRSLHWPLSVVVAQAEHILVQEPLHAVERTLATKRIEKLKQGILALPTN